MNECPVCKRKEVATSGKKNAPILLVGESPDYEELRVNATFVGEAGQALRSELIRAGIQYGECRATLLWRHDPKVGKEFKEQCYAHMMEMFLEELRTARGVLLMGSEVTKICVGQTVSKINACRLPRPALFPSNVEVVVAAYTPKVLLSMVVGDFRLAVQRFADYTKDIRKEYRNGG
jgi:uracil-DNA glycosylase family 4